MHEYRHDLALCDIGCQNDPLGKPVSRKLGLQRYGFAAKIIVEAQR